MVIICDEHPKNEIDDRLSLPVILTTSIIQIINIISVQLFFKASRMNQRYVKEQCSNFEFDEKTILEMQKNAKQILGFFMTVIAIISFRIVRVLVYDILTIATQELFND